VIRVRPPSKDQLLAKRELISLSVIGFDAMIDRNPKAPQNDTKSAFLSAAFASIFIIHILMRALVEPMNPSPFFDIAQ
jgi:hypothetical protein